MYYIVNQSDYITPPIASIIKTLVWVGLIVYVLTSYKDTLIKFIDRIKSFGIKDMVAELENNSGTSMKSEAPKSLSESLENDKFYQTPVITDIQNLILNDIKDNKHSEHEKLRLLIKDLTYARAENLMLKISATILLEQVRLLNYLNINAACKIEGLKQFYVEYPNISYDNFIKYLTDIFTLILINDSNECFITNLGREYLAYRVSNGFPVTS